MHRCQAAVDTRDFGNVVARLLERGRWLFSNRRFNFGTV